MSAPSMAPYLEDADFTLYNADAREALAVLPDESVHCVVTSPPYWGLRDYGTGSWEGGDPDCDHSAARKKDRADYGFGESQVQTSNIAAGFTSYDSECPCGARRVDRQLGLEATPEEYVARMVAVFREVRRVLRRDGTLWLNMGDGYASSPPGNVEGVGKTSGLHGANDASGVYRETLKAGHATKRNTVIGSLKPKDLIGMPWRLAFALQADGWYLRSDIIWAKPNPMPESVTDRPTKAHEYVFLLTKSPRYFFDQEAVREGAQWRRWGTQNAGKYADAPSPARFIQALSKEEILERYGGQRNVRSVWEIATQPYPDAHFATFPEELVRRCVLAGTSERGCCPECGAPWEREVERGYLDWRPTCDCYEKHDGLDADENWPLTIVPCVVLDPFLGSGTSAYVARKLGRRSIGIELSADYCQLAARRMQQQSLFAQETA